MKRTDRISRALTACAVACALAIPSGAAGQPSDEPAGEPSAGPAGEPADGMRGWLSWRGPNQNGTSPEKGLVVRPTPGGDGHLWSYPLAGRGTPVIANGRVYTLGYEGRDADLQELVVCLDEKSGELLWQRRFNDFLSDSVYTRYAIGSPTIDPETGNVFTTTTAGLFMALTPDGATLWEHDLMGEFGRLTFPNGRTGAAVVDGDLIVIHAITAHWGPLGPAADRFYAFDKHTGACVWSATPGTRPYDSSFSMPVLEWRGGRRVLYATTGCGNVVAVDARLGDPLWRFDLSKAGMSSSVVLHGDQVIALNGKENWDTSTIGRMVSIRAGAEPEAGKPGPLVLGADREVWRNDLVGFTSSPIVVGDRVYATDATGELACVDATNGEVLWRHKLAPDQIHASPVWADGKLYVPMNNGSFHVIEPTDEGPQVLHTVQLEGNCLGAPAIANGRIYVHTTEQLYCFGTGEGRAPEWPVADAGPMGKGAGEPGPAARLQVVPADILLKPGERTPVVVRTLDALGNLVSARTANVEWKAPPNLDLGFDETGQMLARERYGAGVMTATAEGLTGSMRVRVVPALNATEDFESFELTEKSPDGGTSMAHPPGHWIGVRAKWEVRELEGEKVLARTLHVPIFQRAMGFIGHPDSSDYTMQIDFRTDGNRRTMSNAGVVHQRYLIQVKGNHQSIEVTSNEERIKESVPFKWKADTWYRLKTRVDVAEDGSGVVRAKCWQRDESEPEGWNIEVKHARAHTHGAPGLFGFALQSRFRVYVDNVSVTSNEG